MPLILGLLLTAGFRLTDGDDDQRLFDSPIPVMYTGAGKVYTRNHKDPGMCQAALETAGIPHGRGPVELQYLAGCQRRPGYS